MPPTIGFSARYCFYVIVDSATKKILDFYVAEKTMVEYSGKMEPYAANVLLGSDKFDILNLLNFFQIEIKTILKG